MLTAPMNAESCRQRQRAGVCFGSDLNQPFSNGFSLVELLVVIALIGILAALGLPSYQAWIQNTQIRTAAESIQNGLQLARSEAVQRNARVRFTLGDHSDWSVGCEPAVGDVDGNGVDDCPAVIQSRSASEGSSVNVSVVVTPAANKIVEFNSFGRLNAAPEPFTQIDLDSTALSSLESRNLRITLGVGGNVRMCDPDANLPSTDPRKC